MDLRPPAQQYGSPARNAIGLILRDLGALGGFADSVHIKLGSPPVAKSSTYQLSLLEIPL